MTEIDARGKARSRVMLAFLVTTFLVIAAMVYAEWRPAGTKRQFVLEIQRLGGQVDRLLDRKGDKPSGVIKTGLQMFLGQEYFADISGISFEPRSLADAQMIACFPEIGRLELRGEVVTDEFLKQLKGLENLNNLSLLKCKIGEQRSEWLEQSNIVLLTLGKCHLSAPFLQSVKQVPNLSVLTLEQCHLDEADLVALHGSASSTTLQVHGMQISEASRLALRAANNNWTIGLPSVTETANISHLALGGPNVTSATLLAMKDAHKLTSLALTDCKIDGDGIELVAQLFPNLTELRVWNMAIGDQGLKAFQSLSNLGQLELVHSRIVGVDIDHYPPGLTHLQIYESELSDEGVEQISKLTGLHSLNIGSPHLTDKCVEHLSKMSGLTFLEIVKSPISDEAMQRLKKALPKATIEKR